MSKTKEKEMSMSDLFNLLSKRLDATDEKFESRFDVQNSNFNKKFDVQNNKFNELNKRFNSNDEKFEILSKEIREQNIQFQQSISVQFDHLSHVLDKRVDEPVSYTHLDVYKRQV